MSTGAYDLHDIKMLPYVADLIMSNVANAGATMHLLQLTVADPVNRPLPRSVLGYTVDTYSEIREKLDTYDTNLAHWAALPDIGDARRRDIARLQAAMAELRTTVAFVVTTARHLLDTHAEPEDGDDIPDSDLPPGTIIH